MTRAATAIDGKEESAEKPAKSSMQDVFGPGGLLERCMIGGYEHRRAQLEMAEMVHDAFETRHHAVVEAGTGKGKTLAYLLPAICSGRRVVISTATKSLQAFCAEFESGGDEGAVELLVPCEGAPDGRPADAKGH